MPLGLTNLIAELLKLPCETEWLEFKDSNFDADMIGCDISALANSAALYGKEFSYMVWGVEDSTHKVVGTQLTRFSKLRGNQELESYLRTLLSPLAHYEFFDVDYEGKTLVVLKIAAAFSQPVTFKKVAYVRVGSYTKKLADTSALEVKLWDALRLKDFEDLAAKTNLTPAEVFDLIDYTPYFTLQNLAIPSSERALNYLVEDELIKKEDDTRYTISNRCACLFAKKLSAFKTLADKAIRVVEYQNANRLTLSRDESFDMGYALAYEKIILFLAAKTPTTENIVGAWRKKESAYPMLALRELVANMMMHQDFSLRNPANIIEIFPDRIEFTNPGSLLIDRLQILTTPPKCRNTRLASLMRRLRMCESLGSGWQKIATACEENISSAPLIETHEDATRVFLFAKRTFRKMPLEQRLWTTYVHTSMLFIRGEALSNASLRERFGLNPSQAASVSGLIQKTLERGWIKLKDPKASLRFKRYVPFWA